MQISITTQFWDENVNSGSENAVRCAGQRDNVLLCRGKRVALDDQKKEYD